MILGTAQFGLDYGISNNLGKISIDEISSIYKRMKLDGMVSLDTAPNYGDSELRIGELFEDFKITTKLKLPPDINELEIGIYLEESIKNSRANLKHNHIQTILLHDINDLKNYGENLWLKLLEFKERGITERIGYSLYNPEDLLILVKKYTPDVVQVPINLLDRRFIPYISQFPEIRFVARSIFLQGLLLMPYKEQMRIFPLEQNLWDKFHSFLESHDLSALDLCLSFARSIDGLYDFIIGISSFDEFMEIRDIINGPICPEIMNLTAMAYRDENLLNPSTWKAW